MKTAKRNRPPTDYQKEKATGCTELLSGIKALTDPKYDTLNRHAGRNDRLLHAVLCAYAKHCAGCDDIGWDQLGLILHSAICNEISNQAYTDWLIQLQRK